MISEKVVFVLFLAAAIWYNLRRDYAPENTSAQEADCSDVCYKAAREKYSGHCLHCFGCKTCGISSEEERNQECSICGCFVVVKG